MAYGKKIGAFVCALLLTLTLAACSQNDTPQDTKTTLRVGASVTPHGEILKAAQEELEKDGIAKNINQYFAVLTDMRSVGVMGDERTYDYLLALRAVTTTDFMTADWADIPHDLLASISNRITNEVDHINRVVYDITQKPPATIEWE